MNFLVGAPMADDSRYKEAIERRAAILAQIQSLQSQLKSINDYVTLHERLFLKKDGNKSETDRVDDDVQPKRRMRNVLPPSQIVDLCRQILIEVGRPMTRTELLDAIADRGIPLAGADPSKNLGTILWRAGDSFQNVHGRGYWLADTPIPPG